MGNDTDYGSFQDPDFNYEELKNTLSPYGDMTSEELVAKKAIEYHYYDRTAALRYARKYWNKPASDNKVDTHSGLKKVPEDSIFKPKLNEDGTIILNDELWDKDGNLIFGVDTATDCTHFICCCVGIPPGDMAGGIPDIYGKTNYQGYFLDTFIKGRKNKFKIGKIIAEISKDSSFINQLSPGDIIIYNRNKKPEHMALLGNDEQIICHTYMRTDEILPEKTWSCNWDLGSDDPDWSWTFVKMYDKT